MLPRMSVKRGRPPGMMDVARLAGVSHQTVSRVLNEHPNVSEPTRLKVRAAIAELGYRPDRAARALVTGTSKVIGVVAQPAAIDDEPANLKAVHADARPPAAADERG